MMRLNNTMSREVEDFQPLNKDTVTIYTCGPTVYDFPHIGNWYAFIRWDLLLRVLNASGYKTKWVLNITDVGHLTSDADEGEDKLEKGAKREHKTAWAVAKEYTDYFEAGLMRLNFTRPDLLPKATDNIPEQIDFIKALEKDGLIYTISDGVYFDTSKLSDYGKLARLDIDKLKAGARVELSTEKRNPTDFALWKFSPKDHKRDMEWDSPWGKGFPGWHLECSAMIKKFLGDTIDIHGGGIDHIPIHHTNEIAQSESANHQPLAKYWIHSNFIKVDGQKISKSLGNIITLEDIEKKGFSLEAFRLLVLESHYRSEAQFSWDTLAAAQNRLNNYRAFADLRFQAVKVPNYEVQGPDYTEYKKDILYALQNDLDTPKALKIFSGITDEYDKRGIPVLNDELKEFDSFLLFINDIFGIDLLASTDISDIQKRIIAQREVARKKSDWQESDKIRQALKEQAIEIHDTEYGPIWSKI